MVLQKYRIFFVIPKPKVNDYLTPVGLREFIKTQGQVLLITMTNSASMPYKRIKFAVLLHFSKLLVRF